MRLLTLTMTTREPPRYPLGTDFPTYPRLSLGTVTEFANLEQALLRRLFTNRGALWYAPRYGLGLMRWLNEGVDDGGYELSVLIENELLEDARIGEAQCEVARFDGRNIVYAARVRTALGPHEFVVSAERAYEVLGREVVDALV